MMMALEGISKNSHFGKSVARPSIAQYIKSNYGVGTSQTGMFNTTLRKALTDAVGKGLLDHGENDQRFKLTEKGRELLHGKKNLLLQRHVHDQNLNQKQNQNHLLLKNQLLHQKKTGKKKVVHQQQINLNLNQNQKENLNQKNLQHLHLLKQKNQLLEEQHVNQNENLLDQNVLQKKQLLLKKVLLKKLHLLLLLRKLKPLLLIIKGIDNNNQVFFNTTTFFFIVFFVDIFLFVCVFFFSDL